MGCMNGWQQMIGHEWAVELLQRAINHQRVGHAYLITGPDNIGKSTLAHIFAQAINCPEPEAPCGICRTCKLIAADRHMDIKLVSPQVSGRGKLAIKIEAIRQLQQDLMLSAYEAQKKVAILERFDTATDSAANAFLKTLEEPPTNVLLLLTANDADTLLPTISSRCRTLSLRPLPPQLIEQSLATRWRIPEEKAKLLAHLADGRLGWAVQAAADPSLLEQRGQALGVLYEALAGDRVARFQIAEKMARKADQLPQQLQTWLSWWQDAVHLSQHANPQSANVPLTNVDENGRLRELAAQWPAPKIISCLRQTNQSLHFLEQNANIRLLVENLLLSYPFISEN